MIALAIFIVAIAYLLIVWSLCKAAKIGDRELERQQTAQRLALQVDRHYWEMRHPEGHWPGR